jgi:type I restriction enzyme R subunit
MFEDEFSGNIQEHQLLNNFNDLDAYKRKVEQYLKEQSHNITIHKLRNNVPITKGELETLDKMLFEQGSIGTKAEFTKAYGEQPLGKFIRSIVGLDLQAAKLAFAEILNNQTLNAQQIRFMDTIINYLNVKGIIEPSMLFEAPFTDINSTGVVGLFEDQIASKIISLIETINNNAEAAYIKASPKQIRPLSSSKSCKSRIKLMCLGNIPTPNTSGTRGELTLPEDYSSL